MGSCRFCGAFTQQQCIVCVLYICTPHMRAHYFHPEHKTTAAKRGIELDEIGKPVREAKSWEDE